MGNSSPVEGPYRRVIFGRQGRTASLFRNNQIYTTKYTYLSFIPEAVLYQFIYPRNFIFLLNAILQSIRAISNLSPVVAILPLVVVILISVVREGWQDYKRRRRDRVVNESLCYVLEGGSFVEKQWQYVEVGDYVAILKHSQIPADVVLLQSSDRLGLAYVETSNLDGERNLKMKQSLFQGSKLYPNQLQQLQGVAEVDPPNENINYFDGTAKINNYPTTLSEQNLLLRGTVLQNTDEAIGLVVYAGMDTKIMRNLGTIRNKINRFEYMLNWIQLVLAVFLFFMVLTCALVYRRIWAPYDGTRNVFYLFRVRHYGVDGEAALVSLSAFILLNTIIPLSLNISLQLIAAFQSDVFENDIRMSEVIEGERIYCTVNNSRTIPQLSIVQYVLTDKTGTLTSNQLELKAIFAGNQVLPTTRLSSMTSFSQEVARFWMLVLICNDIIIDSVTGEYQGSSGDEICFVNFAATIGFKFVKRELNTVYIDIKGQQLALEIVYTIPFDDRKMMSVVFRDPASKALILTTKGADSSVLSKSSMLNGGPPPDLVNNISTFSKSGYRTLVFAEKKVNENEVQRLSTEIANLKQRRMNRQITREQYKEMYQQTVSQIENNLLVTGVTAIEDKLQVGVPDAIRDLRMAGIQVAMITGDKLETAQNIGYLSNFIDQRAEIFRIRDTAQVEMELREIENKIRHLPQAIFSVIIEGEAINRCVRNPNESVRLCFANIVRGCGSVIFCRSTPAQKGRVARFYKSYFKDIVVAIGDGGNDVRMIQEADIGIGILGREGNQASSAADFSISQFRFIERLILHHGRWTLYRMAYFFNYFGFKVTIITIILFGYLAYCGESGTSLLPNAYLAAYNSVLTVVLPIMFAVYDQDINVDMYPQIRRYLPLMYRDSKRLQLFSYWRFFLWTLAAIVTGVWIFFTTLYVLNSEQATDSRGRIPDQFSVAINIQLSLYFFVTLLILVEIRTFNLWFWFSTLILTLLIALIFFIIQTFANVDDAYYALVNNFNLRFWLLVLVNTAVYSLLRYLMIALDYTLWPNSIQVAMMQRNYLPPVTTQRYAVEYAKLASGSTASPLSTHHVLY